MAREALGSGWSSDAVLVDGRWVERTARHAGAERALRTETTLLPWLAPRLPLAVPAPVIVAEAPLRVRHALVPGAPLAPPTVENAAALGAFLAALHAVPLDGAVARGLPDAAVTRGWREASFARFEADVLPRLADPAPHRARLDRLREAPTRALVHGDLRPEHVRVAGGVITGVIDWGSARTADPAKDLAWPLLETPPEVAAAVRDAYGADLAARARDWRDAGPCYAAVHGLDTGDDALVDASLRRLAACRGSSVRRS